MVAADDPVARDDDADGVARIGGGYGSNGFGTMHHLCLLEIGTGVAVGNLNQGVPYVFLERCTYQE